MSEQKHSLVRTQAYLDAKQDLVTRTGKNTKGKLNCSPGNKQCGGRCIPEAWDCRLEGKGTNSEVKAHAFDPLGGVESIERGITGKRALVLSPAIYTLTRPLVIHTDAFVVLGLGFPTLIATNGKSAIIVKGEAGNRAEARTRTNRHAAIKASLRVVCFVTRHFRSEAGPEFDLMLTTGESNFALAVCRASRKSAHSCSCGHLQARYYLTSRVRQPTRHPCCKIQEHRLEDYK